MDNSSNYTYNDKLWRLCPTTTDNNSFFHSAFGTVSDSGAYFDKRAKFRRMRWATFLTYFEYEIVPPLLATTLTKCLSASDKHQHVSIDDKQNFAEYVHDITASEPNVTVAEIHILAALENTTVTIVFNRTGDSVIIVRPNPEILGSYQNIFEEPKEVVLCVEGDTFFRLEPVGVNPKPKSIGNKTEKTTDRSRYKKCGSAGSKGVEYQVTLLALVMLNALKNGLSQWKLSTENEEAGKFDDVVLECSTGDILIQSKHKERKNKITLGDLTSDNCKNDDFSLPKYFLWYQLIKTRFKIKNIIICTNVDVQKNVLEFLNPQKSHSESILYFENINYYFYMVKVSILSELKENTHKYFLKNFLNKGLEESVINDENLKDFLKHLQLYFNYPPQNHLQKIIDNLLPHLKCCSNSRDKLSSSDMLPKVMRWYQQKEGIYFTEIQAKAMFSEIWANKYCHKLEQYEVSFHNNDLNFEGQQIFHITSTGGYLLQVIKIYHAIRDNKLKILFVNPNDGVEIQKQIIEAFALPQYVFLVIIGTKTINKSLAVEMCSTLKDLLRKYTYKKIILVADNSKLARKIGLDNICHIDKFVTFDDISRVSQDKILKKKNIIFQGRGVSLYELLETQPIEDYATALNTEMLEKLIKGDDIKVGVHPLGLDEDTTRYYIDRTFEREVSNTDNEEKINENRSDVLSEESIYQVKEKLILIADIAGAGKSTVLTKLATTIKKNNPYLWVIRINLNDYTKILSDSLKRNRKAISVMEMLNSKKTTKLTSHFEKFIFSKEGKIVLMMDGVDEISPDYTRLILDMLITCQSASNFAKIFITTRPHLTLELEVNLKVVSFKMLPLTEQNQKDLLRRFWTYQLEINDDANIVKCEQYAKTLIAKMYSWVKAYYIEQPLTAIPLQVRILAEVFQENESQNWQGCREYLSGDEAEPKLPEKFNIAELYGMFIEKKRDVFLDKGSGNTAATQALKDKFEECLAYHRSLASRVILSKKQSELFSNYHRDCNNMESYILKIGIVQRASGNFQFVHRTFAEYFVAANIIRELEIHNQNIEFQMFLIDEIFLKLQFEVLRSFLDNLLQKIVDSLPSTIFEKYQSLVHEDDFNEGISKENPIFILTEEGCVAILKLILKNVYFKIIKDKDINIKDWQARTKNKGINTLNDLQMIVRQAGVNIRDESGDTLLHIAIKRGHLEMVKFLIEQGANVDSVNRRGCTALFLAVWFGHLDIVKYLAGQGQDVKTPDDNGRTALHLSAKWGELDTVKYLIEQGVDIDIKNSDGRTALLYAAEEGELHVVKYLVKCGADVNVKDNEGRTTIHLATFSKQLDTIKYLKECGVDVNVRDNNGCTALHLAAESAHLGVKQRVPTVWSPTETVKFFHEIGVDVNVKDSSGNTALHLAACSGDPNIAKYLAEHGADINIRNMDGREPLHLAAKSGNTDTIRYLVERGVDCTIKDSDGRTALHLAAAEGQWDSVKLLIELGTDINAKDNDQRTPLILAAEGGHLDIVKSLADVGIEISNAENKDN